MKVYPEWIWSVSLLGLRIRGRGVGVSHGGTSYGLGFGIWVVRVSMCLGSGGIQTIGGLSGNRVLGPGVWQRPGGSGN